MASSRPGSRNLAEKPASKSQSDLKRNGEVKNSSEKQKKCSTSGRQSQNLDFASHESRSHEKQGQRSQSQQSQRHSASSQKNAGCLEILASEGSFPVLLQPKNRPTSGSTAKKAPSINRINSAPRRTPTPTKQIILEAAKRKQEPTLSLEKTSLRMRPNGTTTGGDEVKDHGQRSPKAHVRTKEDEKKDDEDDDDEEDEDEEEESSSEEELIKAPNELMMEFLDCVLKEDYVNGLKLCTMILLYEPDNAEALAFRSLIEEKMAIDISNQAEDEDDDDDDGEDDEEDDDEDDDEDDSSEDDSDSSDSSSDDDDDDSDGEDETEVKTKAKTNARTIFVP